MTLYPLGPQQATIEEFYQFATGQSMVPDTLDRNLADANLKQASTMVIRRVRLAHMRIGADGFPENAIIKAGLRDATCAQMSYWSPDLEDVDPGDISGVGANWDSVTMAGVTLARRQGSASATASAASLRVAPAMLEILMTLPIWSTRVAVPGWIR